MTRFVVIATTVRGKVDPPELLDAAGQWLANEEAEKSDLADVKVLRYRATVAYRFERDRELTAPEIARLQPQQTAAERRGCAVNRMCDLARMAG